MSDDTDAYRVEVGLTEAALEAMAAYPKARAHLLAQLGVPSAMLTDPNFRASRITLADGDRNR